MTAPVCHRCGRALPEFAGLAARLREALERAAADGSPEYRDPAGG